MNISLNTAYPGNSAGLEWTLNSPSPEVASFTTVAGPAAVSAQKTLSCSNQTCLLTGLNSTPFVNGVVATVTLNLSPAATGNLVVQLANPVEALLDGTGGSIMGANGLVSVGAISVSVTPPAGLSLSSASKVCKLSAMVAGTTNSSVTWTMAPPVGILSNSGLYTAPSAISNSQTVVVTATSVADPTKSASSVITLVPPVSVTLSPPVVSLRASQTQQFTAAVSNTANALVTWSLNPSVGSIVNGRYTAPANITSPQTVNVIATSVADPSMSASATITLVTGRYPSL